MFPLPIYLPCRAHGSHSAFGLKPSPSPSIDTTLPAKPQLQTLATYLYPKKQNKNTSGQNGQQASLDKHSGTPVPFLTAVASAYLAA